MKINGIEAYSGSIILPSARDTGEITVNGSIFKLKFEDNNGKIEANFELKNDVAIFIFKNISDPLGVYLSFDIPLMSGGKTQILFALYTIGSGSERAILIHYTYRDIK